MVTGYVWLERYGWHDTRRHAGFVPSGPFVQPGEHFENELPKTRFASLIEVSGLGAVLERLPVEPVSRDDLLLVHPEQYVDRIIRESEAPLGGAVEPGTPFGNGGYDIACLAAGGTRAALAAVVDGTVANAYALVRPPGHHARPEVGMGFCFFSNIGVAIRSLRRQIGDLRVAVVDWDVHHGNGTQEIFWDDPEVMTISLHQDQLYPLGSGYREEIGGGAAVGANLNVPLPAGSGDGAYVDAMTRVVVPALRRFRPDVIVVASGFDASIHDPLGRMMVTASGFRSMTRILLDAAAELCDGRVAMTHEGGYSAAYVPICGVAVIEELSGVRTAVGDPFVSDELASTPDQALQPHQSDAIALAEAKLAGIPARTG